MIENIRATDVTLRVQSPHTPPPPPPDHHGKAHKPEFLFQCEGHTSATGIVFERLNISWEGTARSEWIGVQNGTSCVTIIEDGERK
jgi:hypothetical protein